MEVEPPKGAEGSGCAEATHKMAWPRDERLFMFISATVRYLEPSLIASIASSTPPRGRLVRPSMKTPALPSRSCRSGAIILPSCARAPAPNKSRVCAYKAHVHVHA